MENGLPNLILIKFKIKIRLAEKENTFAEFWYKIKSQLLEFKIKFKIK